MKVIYTIMALIVINAFFAGVRIVLGLDDSVASSYEPKYENNNSLNKYSDICWEEQSQKGDKNLKTNKSKEEKFEEADSYYDKYGNEHIVDYDGYCEECDDYHW